MSTQHHNKFGWKPGLPDHRDWKYSHSRMALEAPPKFPSKVDLRSMFGPCYDQGDLGSCTGNGIAAVLEFDRKKQKLKDFIPSRLFIYYNERVIEGTINQDSGAEIKNGIKSVAQTGYCEETIWPYNISEFTVKPPKQAYDEAVRMKALNYYSIDNSQINQLKSCLAAGYPIVFGATVYESLYSADNNHGIVSMPHPSEQPLGGHCIVIVGYDDSKKLFIIRNSWGTNCGDKGYYYFPYNYITSKDLCDDFWTIRSISR